MNGNATSEYEDEDALTLNGDEIYTQQKSQKRKERSPSPSSESSSSTSVAPIQLNKLKLKNWSKIVQLYLYKINIALLLKYYCCKIQINEIFQDLDCFI